MAVNLQNEVWIPNWTNPGTTGIAFPVASFPQMTDAEAAVGTGGDIRAVLFAICTELQAHWDGLATADRPTKMTLSKTTSLNSTTGIITYSYRMNFQVEILTEEVEAE